MSPANLTRRSGGPFMEETRLPSTLLISTVLDTGRTGGLDEAPDEVSG